MPLSYPEYLEQRTRIIKIFNKAREDAIERIREGNTGKITMGNSLDSISKLNSVIMLVENRSHKAYAVTYQHRRPMEIVFYAMRTYKLTDADIYEISLHELAHVLVSEQGHSILWKYTYEGIGGNRPLVRYFLPAGKHYHYHIPVGMNPMTGRLRYRNFIADEVYKQKHPDLDKYIIQVTESS